MRAYAPEVVEQSREFWVGKNNLKQRKETNKMKKREYKTTSCQRFMPYLIKQKFVPLESSKVDLQRYVHEDEPDNQSRGGYKGFKQSKDNYKAQRLNPNEPITRKNPFVSADRIKVCNSF